MDPLVKGWLIRALFVLPLLAACYTDLTRYRIPNALCAVMALSFPVALWLAPAPVPWFLHVLTALAVLGAGMVLFIPGLMGGGDIKLMAACALWMGPTVTVAALVLTALVGGVLSLILLGCRALPASGAWPVLRKGAPVPYGLAIALGGIMVVSRLPMLAGT